MINTQNTGISIWVFSPDIQLFSPYLHSWSSFPGICHAFFSNFSRYSHNRWKQTNEKLWPSTKKIPPNREWRKRVSMHFDAISFIFIDKKISPLATESLFLCIWTMKIFLFVIGYFPFAIRYLTCTCPKLKIALSHCLYDMKMFSIDHITKIWTKIKLKTTKKNLVKSIYAWKLIQMYQ